MQGFSFMTKRYIFIDFRGFVCWTLRCGGHEYGVEVDVYREARCAERADRGDAFFQGRGGAVAPKYRNPENPTETWAGRGLKPRWLTAAIKSGKKAEDFLIAGAAAFKANGGKTTPRKARKSAKK
jgi:hypothetical protein